MQWTEAVYPVLLCRLTWTPLKLAISIVSSCSASTMWGRARHGQLRRWSSGLTVPCFPFLQPAPCHNGTCASCFLHVRRTRGQLAGVSPPQAADRCCVWCVPCRTFKPAATIKAHHANVKDSQFGVDFIKGEGTLCFQCDACVWNSCCPRAAPHPTPPGCSQVAGLPVSLHSVLFVPCLHPSCKRAPPHPQPLCNPLDSPSPPLRRAGTPDTAYLQLAPPAHIPVHQAHVQQQLHHLNQAPLVASTLLPCYPATHRGRHHRGGVAHLDAHYLLPPLPTPQVSTWS